MKRISRIYASLVRQGKINPDDFYSITIYSGYVHLQGFFNPVIVKSICNLGHKPTADLNGYIQFNLGTIQVTLTNQ